MKLLPGVVATPDWPGPRCPHCARGIGGDGSLLDCKDANLSCLTWDRVPAERIAAYAREHVWSNVSFVIGAQGGTVLEAIDWMVTPRADGATPLQMLRGGRGRELIDAQYEEFPVLARQAEKMERLRAEAAKRAQAAAANE